MGCNDKSNITGESNSTEDTKNQEVPTDVQFDDDQENTISSSSYPEIDGTWERVGNSGHGIDIVARDKIYILGTDKKIFYYDSSANDWIQEPSGGKEKEYQ